MKYIVLLKSDRVREIRNKNKCSIQRARRLAIKEKLNEYIHEAKDLNDMKRVLHTIVDHI